MDPERLQKIERCYHAALEREESLRVEFLREACGADESLRREVESLLAYSHKAEGFIELPAMELAARAMARDEVKPSARWLPFNIDHYRTLRLLGEGGMGIVYEAEQEQPRRKVALKVIKPGLASPELLRRFEQESHALGRLQHPGIAQIYEAGTADSGFGPQPYFAMEFIRGESLLEYAAVHQLNTRARLELMAKVCEAVHHAHQRGIIHRDMKPGNILVDESGQPKVLDFGVARVTDSDVQTTRQTDLGQLVGTLAYMSPEQVLADPLELDTRSDVYALGVILYELLAGRLPYTVSRNLPEAVQTILEEDPVRLSSISRHYRGDIETIVAKALEKDKERRYASAADLAGDIRRCLADEPIVARPPSASYQFQKFARRHKALVAGVTAVFVVLVAGIIATTSEATRARRAEQAAMTQAATAKAVNNFLQNDLLAQASANNQARPDVKPDPDLKVRTALDRAAAKIDGKFTTQPLVEASVRQTIGDTYKDLGLYPEAQRQMDRALDLKQHVLGGEHGDTLTSMQKLGEIYHDQGEDAQAETMLTKVLEVRRRVLGEAHPLTLDTMDDLALLYHEQGKYAQAEPLYTKVLALQRRMLGEEHPDTITSMVNLGALYFKEGKNVQAEPLATKVLEVKRRVLGREHPETLNIMNNLGLVYFNEGKYAQGQTLLREALEVERRVLGREHPLTLQTMNNLAVVYRFQGKYAQAEPLSTEAVDGEQRVMGEEHPKTLNAMRHLALLYEYQGKYMQAGELYSRILEARRRVLGKEHFDTLTSMNDLAFLYLNQRKYGQAEALLREALNTYQKTKINTWDRYNCQSLLGSSLASQKKYAEAEALLLSGYDGMLQQKDTIPAYSRFRLEQARKWIVQLYQDWRKPKKAADWREKLEPDHVSATHTQ